MGQAGTVVYAFFTDKRGQVADVRYVIAPLRQGGLKMSRLRVLLVDDHPFFRDALASWLMARGMEVAGEACDGLEALEKVRILRPDLVLMDVNMPRLSALEAHVLLKAEMPSIRVVMLAASEEDQNILDAIRSGDWAVCP